MTAAISGGIGAILLAGGRGSRMDGAVKPLFEVGGSTLLGSAVDAAGAAGAHPITVVSPVLDDTLPVDWVREDPPFGGPAAALVAALGSWSEDDDPEWTLVLACDLPRVHAAVVALVAETSREPATDGVCLVDASGRNQWLIAAYRTASLRRASDGLASNGQNVSMKALVSSLEIRSVAAPDQITRDIDTWEDLLDARRTARPPSAIRPLSAEQPLSADQPLSKEPS